MELPTTISLILSEHTADGLPPRVFALADVDARGQFNETWVALTNGHLVIVDCRDGREPERRMSPARGKKNGNVDPRFPVGMVRAWVTGPIHVTGARQKEWQRGPALPGAAWSAIEMVRWRKNVP